MLRISSFLTKNSQNASFAALAGSIIALFGSVISAYLSYYYSMVTQNRQSQLEQLSKFEASASQIVEAGGQFIDAINNKKELASIRVRFSAILASQLFETQGVARMFQLSTTGPITAYENSLSDLNLVLRKTSSAEDMRPWAESFGRTLDLKSELSRVLYAKVGVQKS